MLARFLVAFTLLFGYFTPALANTPGVACEFFTMPVAGCGPDKSKNVANCVIVENPTPYYAELGIQGICPVGSGASITRPANGLPAYVDATPADPTTGARNVAVPYTNAYIFLRADPTDPYWQVPVEVRVEARLFSQVTAGVVPNAQFVPSLTHVATPTSGGPVGAGYFCQPVDTKVYKKATVRRENFCD